MSLSRKKTVLKTGRQSTGRKRSTGGETKSEQVEQSQESRYWFNDQPVGEEEYNRLMKEHEIYIAGSRKKETK